MRPPYHRPVIVFLLVLLLTACSGPGAVPQISETEWKYADLRLVDAPDASTSIADLVAVYLRGSKRELQVRLDFLDLSVRPDLDIYLALDTGAGGVRNLPVEASADLDWDTLVMIPALGSIQTLDASGKRRSNLAVWVQRSPSLDYITVQINRLPLPQTRLEPRLQAFITLSGSKVVEDQSALARLAGRPPARAQVLFAFRNVFPAYTPALALRRWDGAHTGPLGGRHGLYNLLRTARSHSIPLTLLDLKTPTSLSALDYTGGLDLVREMAEAGLLTLPEAVPAFPEQYPEWITARAAVESRTAAAAFGLSPSPFLYLPNGPAQLQASDDHRGLFLGPASQASVEDSQELLRAEDVETVEAPALEAAITDPVALHVSQFTWSGKTAIRIPESSGADQLDEEGLSLSVRRALVESALAGQEQGSSLIILGGDLPNSAWGVPQLAREAFVYLRAHPWIQFTNPLELLARSAPPAEGTELAVSGHLSPSNLQSGPHLNRQATLFEALRQEQGGPLADTAWQALVSLHAPLSPEPEGLEALRSLYLGQVGVLLSAARWAAAPVELSSCQEDLDGDGSAECVLASDEVFAVFEPDTGALSYAFALDASNMGPRGIHQLIAPSSQFVVGLSPALGWDLGRGLAADPAVIPGAFGSEGPFEIDLQPRTLSFRSPDGSQQKTYTLIPGGLSLCLRVERSTTFQAPVAFDPWQRYQPGWWENYGEQPTEELQMDSIPRLDCLPEASSGLSAWAWGQADGLKVQVLASAPVRTRTFLDSRKRMGLVEDPNTEFPPGHYLPFPLALLEFEAQGPIELLIRLSEDGPILAHSERARE